ncbi:hypothetical protein D8Y22_07150 [Salinadaptatus halalkaliphilus]|uniref:von Willebrand factor type A n=1 Tax=Salinadaptatus halalkaliphilus TaxID=2419781 RepID=A0A4S3TMX8_9EURY|nr:SipW-dependent-type signal peptide-containing protein [Salinadaptatus halalkaliphilus]THE65592.1 hypothetical protein D8Y22_07150 [Salinadaptatus halalkaliphilus]
MSKKIELTRRKALAGIGAIGAASAGAGLGTSAFFSDQTAFEGNELAAGELDLRIDWQQLYFGPEENQDHYTPYGEAGPPFVNAHPDHNTNGMQSLDLGAIDEGEFATERGTVSYMDEVENPESGANIQEYLTCETLANFEEPADFANGIEPEQEHLIELDDVKPGDCGEVTFSLHLCDNPGYIWMLAETGEYDADLAEAIQVQAWYDLGCTNTLLEDDGDTVLIETTDLKTFLDDRLSPDGRLLNPDVYGEGVESGGDPGDPQDLDPITLEENGAAVEYGEVLEIRDENDDGVDEVEIELRLVPEDESVWFDVVLSDLQIPTPDGQERTAVDADADDLSNIRQFDWDIVDASDDFGFGEILINEDGDTLVTFDGCTTGQTNVRIPESEGEGEDEDEINVIEFRYCPDGDFVPPCFPPNETFCVAFEWCLPTTTPSHLEDINELQGRSLRFDLGFYTEQCRHNDIPSGPSGF